jgi:GxxExxY protein
MEENTISGIILDAIIRVHRELGPGLYENIYEAALFLELTEGYNLTIEKQVPISAIYRDTDLGIAFRADLIVEGKVIIELKSVENIQKVHAKQLQTYLRLTGLKLGLLINCNESLIKNGITRIVNGL